ncbi:MAG TPA: hypothetical protein VNY75_11530, partial [Rhizomicrobium sp.]|nr:hypothetical protein [Rhizomicrobium sp.]
DSVALRFADMLTSSPFDVISPTRTFQYRGAAKAGAAQALKADFLIDGDIRREHGLIQVTMRLVDGHSNTTVVAGTFERPAAEADSVPDEIAVKMASLTTMTRGLKMSAGWDPRVIAAYFRANYLAGARNDFYGANETAREAARIAPYDAFAQTLHGYMAAYLVDILPPDRKPAMVAEAREAANSAIQLDPGCGDAYAVLALITPPFDWAVREQYLKRALAILPDAQTAQIQLIELLQNAGRFHESGLAAESLFARGPSQMRPLVEVINTRLWQGQPGVPALIARGRKAMKYSEMGVQYSKMPWFVAKLFEVAAFHGAPGDAEALMRDPTVRNLLEQDSRPTFSRIAVALHHHRRADVDAAAGDCTKPDDRSAEVTRTCFMALVALERLDDAFRLAAIFYPDQRGATPQERQQRWFSAKMMSVAYLLIPQMVPLRADPRFREVAERIGLLQYWQSSHHPPDFCLAEKAPVCALLKSS